jgi:hypothetical protein
LINAAWKFPPVADITVAADADVGRDLMMLYKPRPEMEICVGENLFDAFNMACEKAGTDKAIVFDGLYGAMNVTRSMGEYLVAKAPEVAREVDEVLLPKYLKQRGLALAAAG